MVTQIKEILTEKITNKIFTNYGKGGECMCHEENEIISAVLNFVSITFSREAFKDLI